MNERETRDGLLDIMNASNSQYAWNCKRHEGPQFYPEVFRLLRDRYNCVNARGTISVVYMYMALMKKFVRCPGSFNQRNHEMGSKFSTIRDKRHKAAQRKLKKMRVFRYACTCNTLLSKRKIENQSKPTLP
jgi:hypothetical protein